MVVSLKTDLRFPIPGQQGYGDRIIQVEDLTLFSEMKNMTGRYKIRINKDMIFGFWE